MGAFDPVISNIISQPDPPRPRRHPACFLYGPRDVHDVAADARRSRSPRGNHADDHEGHAHTPASWLPDFDFTVSQDFGLQANGASADFSSSGGPLDTSSSIRQPVPGPGPGRDWSAAGSGPDQSHARDAVRSMLSADANLGGFFDSLLASARPKRVPRFEVQLGHDVELQYSSVKIRPPRRAARLAQRAGLATRARRVEPLPTAGPPRCSATSAERPRLLGAQELDSPEAPSNASSGPPTGRLSRSSTKIDSCSCTPDPRTR